MKIRTQDLEDFIVAMQHLQSKQTLQGILEIKSLPPFNPEILHLTLSDLRDYIKPLITNFQDINYRGLRYTGYLYTLEFSPLNLIHEIRWRGSTGDIEYIIINLQHLTHTEPYFFKVPCKESIFWQTFHHATDEGKDILLSIYPCTKNTSER